MSEKTATNVNFQAMAITAFARVQKITQALEPTAEQFQQCREMWRDYGHALNALRAQHTSDKLFGQEVKLLGVDAPPADSSVIRSDAMWLDTVWATLHRCKVELGGSHNPRVIRKICRERGFAWASDAQASKPTRDRSIYKRLQAENLLAITANSKIRRRVVDELFAESGLPKMARPEQMTAEQFACIDAGIVRMQLKRRALPVDDTIAQERDAAALSPSMRERFDKTVSRVTEALRIEFQKQFNAAVAAEVERRLPDEIKEARERATEAAQRAHHAVTEFNARRDAIPQAMTRDDWRLLLNCLHPDRAPADRQERYAEAFATVKRLESCLRD